MATFSLMTFVFAIFFFLHASSSFESIPLPSSSAVSSQLKFWAENVGNSMPRTLVSKLSQDSTSLAYLSCFLGSTRIRPLANNYGYGSSKSSHIGTPDKYSFFTRSALKQGAVIHLPDLHDVYPRRFFLSFEIASKISLNKTHLKNIFPWCFDSNVTEEAILLTLQYCNSLPLEGEIKSCLISLEDMIMFSKSVLDTNRRLISLTSQSANGSGNEVWINTITQYLTENVVTCHDVFLPFATYSCHYLPQVHLFAVDVLKPSTKLPINTLIVMCHTNTSSWPSTHVAFAILGSSPGQGDACHFIYHFDLVWIPEGMPKTMAQ